MSKTMLMTNEEVLRAAGVTAAEIAAIKTADATTAVNTLDAIHLKLMSFVYEQRIEWANLRNPLKALEKGYAAFNGGKLNGMFSETLVPPKAKGADGLYGGVKHDPKTVRNPYLAPDFGPDPWQYVYGINAKIDRYTEYNINDFLMAFKEGSLLDYARSRLPVIDQESNGSRYAIENNVLNVEQAQAFDYADADIFTDPYELQSYMYGVFDSVTYPEDNMNYKRTKFNTTRGTGNLVLIIESQFWFDFAQKFQLSNFLKPFVFREQDGDRYGVEREVSRIIRVNTLTPTTIPEGQILDPLNMTAATLPANSKLVARIVDFNAVKFGVGKKDAVSYPLSARVMHYDQTEDYVFNMCDAYTNVPILVSTSFDANRKFYVVNDTPETQSAKK